MMLALASVHAQDLVRVRTAAELKNSLKKATPGLTIQVEDGLYDFGGTIVLRKGGDEGKPLVISAAHRGKAVFIGDSRFRLEAVSHVVIEGFEFAGTEGPAVELKGCQNIRITRNVFHLQETMRSSWVMIDGLSTDTTRFSMHNRVDHNLFEKKSVLGNFITIEGTRTAAPQVSQFDRIDRNHFRDIGPRVENALEAIRVGGAEYSLSSGFTVLEENLFERCDGDPEYISIKSSDDTIRHNTFRECLGSLSLRHGNRNTVDGNIILGNGRTGTFLDSTGRTRTLGTGGLRFYGNGMRIINNYFEGLTGSRWDATFAVTNGNAEYGDGQPLTKHFRIHDATIAFNTLVNNRGNFEIGYDGEGFQGNWWHLPPEGLHIHNNIIVGTQDTLIKIFTAPVNCGWEDNIAWATGSAVVSRSPINGVRLTDPGMVKDGETWRVPNWPARLRPLRKSDVGPDAK